MLEDKRLDKDVPIPLYFQLEKLILEEIDNGNYPVGSMIPTEMELSQMFGISRTTVRQAISDLVREEHLYRIKSKGTFVAHPKLVQGFIQSIQSFDDDVRSTGRTPSTEVLDLKLVELEPEVAQLMELPAGTKAIYLYRKRFADDEPIVRVETYLPYEACSFIPLSGAVQAGRHPGNPRHPYLRGPGRRPGGRRGFGLEAGPPGSLFPDHRL